MSSELTIQEQFRICLKHCYFKWHYFFKDGYHLLWHSHRDEWFVQIQFNWAIQLPWAIQNQTHNFIRGEVIWTSIVAVETQEFTSQQFQSNASIKSNIESRNTRKNENRHIPDLERAQEYDNCDYAYAFLAMHQCLEKGIHSNKMKNNNKTK